MLKNQQLVLSLIEDGWLKTPQIIEAFLNIKREDFVPDNEKEIAYLNTALPIGFNQTISQPLVVAFMLELLQPQKGEKILDIGSGSGWTTALLS
ncbi:MAG: protein-L-isoaspartate O-methyltransferase family protein, partial [Minisyncoccia bacterium]